MAINRSKSWHVERGIPVALIVALLTQLVVTVWMASKYDSKFIDHDTRLLKAEGLTETNKVVISAVAERLSRIEGQLQFLIETAKTKPR